MIIVLIIVILYISFVVWTAIRIKRGDLVKWDNQWYTKEELAKKFPPQVYEVESKNTPEEVYAKFRQALLDNDIETALSQIREEKRDLYKDVFGDKGKFNIWVNKLPEKLIKIREEGNYSYFDVDYGTEFLNTATFIKNINGYWEIDQI